MADNLTCVVDQSNLIYFLSPKGKGVVLIRLVVDIHENKK